MTNWQMTLGGLVPLVLLLPPLPLVLLPPLLPPLLPLVLLPPPLLHMG